jgi:hypothetical protein
MSVHRTSLVGWEALCGATPETDPEYRAVVWYGAVTCPKCRPTFWGGKP